MKNSSVDLKNSGTDAGRRAFLRRSGQLALTGTALPFALNMAAIGEAAAFEASDYKALVCVYLGGGNDYANTVVTYDDPSYAKYYAIRNPNGMALSKNGLAATLLRPATPLPDGRQYALNPAMAGLANLFNTGKAAIQLNVGPLITPLTRAQYNARALALPPKLMSHNDQASMWQSLGTEGVRSGWGGRMGDLALAGNGASNFTCISASGNAVFVSGQKALQYQVSTGGAIGINAIKNNVYGSSAVKAAMNTLITQNRAHPMEQAYNEVTTRSIASEALVTAGIGSTSAVTTPFPSNNTLADQLKIVARLIAARNSLGSLKRQVFFVSLGGFDLHDNLGTGHAPLLTKVSEAMTAFYNATVALGVADQVTAFTASDFGRTLATNGNGSDHGWGSHHFVVGGAVKGNAFYGSAPPVSIGNTTAAEDQWHIGQGRLLPSTSVDQYAATMARWFGVADSELPNVLPNLKNFGAEVGRPDYPRDMGFMSA
ncbi:DUF1501 domain-containing protein [Xylophilus sp. GOD-11R]|uniref:DUF1501 domain-containing protein n=1 Tax=Xylophilus sp. GOD-11R TaxID=3089814 RepID=UPI00298C6788|nr:DUF1501 domain-containing protein [Xylophilus sp. GOD-11R]WPB55975.1 DUF1501 domain-containing protein [Xylophilus sp. GOD-11R]